MGFLDRFRKKKPPAEPPEQVAVPRGHGVLVHAAPVEPSVQSTVGNVVIAGFGVAGDDPERELAHVLGALDAASREPAGPALVVFVNRELRISELFAPADPEVVRSHAPVLWVFHRGSVAAMAADPRRLQALLRTMHRRRNTTNQPTSQAVYIVDPPGPRTLPFARLVRGLGIPVKQPDDRDGDLVIMIEVERPEGIVLCALAGRDYSDDGPPDPHANICNEARDRAEAAGDAALVERLGADERAGLAERIAAPEAPPAVLRAHRLGRMILALEREEPDALDALCAELLTRTAPIYLMRDPETRAIEVRVYGDVGRALPTFADLLSLERASRDMGLSPDAFEIRVVRVHQLLAMAADGGVGVAICTYRDDTPVYAVLSGERVQAMARSCRE